MAPRPFIELALAALLAPVAWASAQDAPAPTDVPRPASSEPAASSTAASEGAKVVVPGVAGPTRSRPPLVREGSFLSRTSGTLARDSDGGWVFTPFVRERGGLEREFVLQPNATLDDAIRTQHLAPTELSFELSGEVFIYRGRNFVLASMLTPMVAAIPVPPSPQAPASAQPTRERDLASIDEEEIAEELERRLAERMSSLPKASAPAVAEIPGIGPASGPRRGAIPGDTRIQSRRGHMVRDAATGGWRFVFDGQTAQGGEPSMPILPCLALERTERLVREFDGQLPLLISGTTTLFEGRSFLLPSAIRSASGGRGINP